MSNDEQNGRPAPPAGQAGGEEILEAYRKRFWQRSKFWLGVVMLLALAVLAFVYKKVVLDTAITPDELKGAVAFFDISSQWRVTEKVDDSDFHGVILAPEVSFRLRNASQKNLSYVFLLGVFRFMDNGKVIGEGYRMTLRTPLPPGGESERVTLNAGFGYRASSAAAFEKNRENWRNASCEIFAKSHNSGLVPLKTFYISRRIAGQDIEVELR
jgi:hypothetical protein